MKSIVLLVLGLVSSQIFAAGAVEYNCLGKDSLTGQSVVFQLIFADSVRGVGYTNQAITITRKGWEDYKNPVVFQMYDATDKNTCQRNESGEIYLNADLDMTPTPEGDIAAYTVNVKSSCDQAAYDVKAYCLFQY